MFFSINVDISIGVVFVALHTLYLWEFMETTSLSCSGKNYHAAIIPASGFHSLQLLLCNAS